MWSKGRLVNRTAKHKLLVHRLCYHYLPHLSVPKMRFIERLRRGNAACKTEERIVSVIFDKRMNLDTRKAGKQRTANKEYKLHYSCYIFTDLDIIITHSR